MIFDRGDKILFIGDSISDYSRAKPVGEGLFNAWGTSYVACAGALLGAFVACRLSTLLLDMAFMGVTVDFLGTRWIGADAGKSWTLWKNAMKLASNVVVVVVNYVLSKRVIFRKK